MKFTVSQWEHDFLLDWVIFPRTLSQRRNVKTSIPDLRSFCIDPDPDPWIRTLDYGSGSGSFSFCTGFQDAKFLNLFIAIGNRCITLVFKDNMSLRSLKTIEIVVYLNCFACWWKNPDPDPRGPKTYGFYGSGTLVKSNSASSNF